MKAISLFGGVQAFNILIQIIRFKFIAILLGPAGMGIMGMFVSTIAIISSLTNFGLGTSAIKDIAAANNSKDNHRITLIVTVFQRLVWITGTLGSLVTLILSRWLSQLTFGNKDYTLAFIWISITFLLQQLSSGQLVVLQGMRKLQYLAKANISGSVLGLLVTLPLYFIWGIDGIVPGLIGTALVSLMMSWYFSHKVKVERTTLSCSQTIIESKNMLRMGFMISISGLLTVCTSYVFRVFINHTGDLAQVGLYNAGFSILETYVGLVFTAMATDYYPRLSAVNQFNEKIRIVVTQQAIIAILILAPIIVGFIVFAPLLIKTIFSTQFLEITPMLNWAILGMLFRAASWCMGFILFAKSDSRLFLKTALGFNAIFLINNIYGYKLLGLEGVGISFLINYAIHFFSLVVITYFKYKFKFTNYFYKLFSFCFAFCIIAFAITYLHHSLLKTVVNFALIVSVLIFSIHELNKHLNLFELDFIKKIKA